MPSLLLFIEAQSELFELYHLAQLRNDSLSLQLNHSSFWGYLSIIVENYTLTYCFTFTRSYCYCFLLLLIATYCYLLQRTATYCYYCYLVYCYHCYYCCPYCCLSWVKPVLYDKIGTIQRRLAWPLARKTRTTWIVDNVSLPQLLLLLLLHTVAQTGGSLVFVYAGVAKPTVAATYCY